MIKNGFLPQNTRKMLNALQKQAYTMCCVKKEFFSWPLIIVTDFLPILSNMTLLRYFDQNNNNNKQQCFSLKTLQKIEMNQPQM